MMDNYWYGPNMMYGFPSFFPWLAPFVLLDLVLKGFALWRSARNDQLYWFIALLVINSLGILPLIYLLLYPSSKLSKR